MAYEITAGTPVTDRILGIIANIPTEDIPRAVDPAFMKALSDEQFMRIATLLAKKGLEEGGCPIGAVIIDNDTRQIMGKGHNMLMQTGSPITHGETAATEDAGRVATKVHGQKFANFSNATMFTTLTPCDVCCGQALRSGFDRVVIGDATNAPSSADLIQANSPETKVEIKEDPMAVAQYAKYAREHQDKHFTDWMGNRFWEEHKHLPFEDIENAAIERTKIRHAAIAKVLGASVSARMAPKNEGGWAKGVGAQDGGESE